MKGLSFHILRILKLKWDDRTAWSDICMLLLYAIQLPVTIEELFAFLFYNTFRALQIAFFGSLLLASFLLTSHLFAAFFPKSVYWLHAITWWVYIWQSIFVIIDMQIRDVKLFIDFFFFCRVSFFTCKSNNLYWVFYFYLNKHYNYV